MADDEIFAYPNPAKGKVTFLLPNIQPANIEIVIFNMSGDKVAALNESLLPVGKGLEWKCSDIGPGIYLVKAKINIQGAEKALKIKKIAVIKEK